MTGDVTIQGNLGLTRIVTDAERIRGMLMLTQVEQIIEKEKQDAIEEATRRVTETVTENVTLKVTRDVTDRIAIRLLNAGSSPEFVASNTGLSLEYVQKLSESHN